MTDRLPAETAANLATALEIAMPADGQPPALRDAGQLPQMISYAQNFEDVTLRRALLDVTAGYYVDVGACDPTIASVTRWFYDQGWSGINIEPVPGQIDAFDRDRPRDVNIAAAAGAAAGTATLHVMQAAGLSSIVDQPVTAAQARGFPAVGDASVPMVTVDDLLDAHGGGRVVDFLKIDVEGAEAAVLAGISFKRHRPRIVLIEATIPHDRVPNHAEWEPYLLERGYLFAWFDGLNRFYVRTEDAHRLPDLQLPPSVFDNFVPSPLHDAWAQINVLGHQVNDRTQEAAAARHEAAVLGQESASLRTRLAEVEANLAAHMRQLAQQQDHIAHLERHAAGLDQHNATLIERVDALQHHIDGQALLIDEQARRIAADQAIMDDGEAHRAVLISRLAEQAALIDAQHTQLIERARQLQHAETAHAALQASQAALLASASWRLTGPLRRVRRLLHRWR